MKSSYETIFELIEKTPEFKMFWSDMIEKTNNANISIDAIEFSVESYYDTKPASVDTTFLIDLPAGKERIYNSFTNVGASALVGNDNIVPLVDSVFGKTVKTYGCTRRNVLNGKRGTSQSFDAWLRIKYKDQLSVIVNDLNKRIMTTRLEIISSDAYKLMVRDALLADAVGSIKKVLKKYSSLTEEDLQDVFNAYITDTVMSK